VKRSQPLTCAEVHALLEPWMDGELEAQAARRVHLHVESCPGCADEADAARRVREGLGALPLLACPDSVVQPVLRQARRRLLRGLPRPASTALLAAAATLLLVVGALFLMPTSPPRPDASPQELAQAEQDARLAMAYFAEISRRASLTLRDEVIARHVSEVPMATLDALRNPAEETP
jgi:anti-sigma factor RsiW